MKNFQKCEGIIFLGVLCLSIAYTVCEDTQVTRQQPLRIQIKASPSRSVQVRYHRSGPGGGLTKPSEPLRESSADGEDEDDREGEPSFQELATKLNLDKDNSASADTKGIEVIGPSRGVGMPADAAEGVEDAAEGDSAVSSSYVPPQSSRIIPPPAAPRPMAPKVQKGSGSSIKMMSCGGAPDNLLPFKRDVTPWGQGKSFFGIMPDNDPQRGRRLLEDVGLEAFSALNGTLLEGEEGEELYEPTDPWGELLGAAGNGTADGCGGGQPSAPGRRLASSIPRRRHMGLRSSGSEMRRTGCTKTLRRVPLENNGFGPRARPLSRSGDSHIRSCLQSPSKCTPSSFSYAKSLPGIRQLSQIPKASLGKKRFRSCALVGNAGHMVKKKYGPYIDRHEVVVRFNVLGTKKFSSYVGEKTTFRVLNNARSADACCSGKLPESKGNPIGLILVVPGWQVRDEAEVLRQAAQAQALPAVPEVHQQGGSRLQRPANGAAAARDGQPARRVETAHQRRPRGLPLQQGVRLAQPLRVHNVVVVGSGPVLGAEAQDILGPAVARLGRRVARVAAPLHLGPGSDLLGLRARAGKEVGLPTHVQGGEPSWRHGPKA
eukprot:CAMPEP_0177594670 /NCGR_PEP_ID=MMETSP0419_2-20121207/9908_1 /TAXON_ID=582737 /ORGANISM="Tetraselmis sp., Strain GSL018" /LENGTH=601 /DNA_ID=CAMNT_0019086001 /DNA_START=176 /DNA_END=1980 /DNA_ORIENTATION=-